MPFNLLGAGAGAGVGLEALLARLREDEDSKVKNAVAQQEVNQRLTIAQMNDRRMRDQNDILDKQRRDLAAGTAADRAATQSDKLVALLKAGPVSAKTRAAVLAGNPGLDSLFQDEPGAQVTQSQGMASLPQSAPSGLVPGTSPGTLAMRATPVMPAPSMSTTTDPTSTLNAPSTINFTGINQKSDKPPTPRGLQQAEFVVSVDGKPTLVKGSFDSESGGYTWGNKNVTGETFGKPDKPATPDNSTLVKEVNPDTGRETGRLFAYDGRTHALTPVAAPPGFQGTKAAPGAAANVTKREDTQVALATLARLDADVTEADQKNLIGPIGGHVGDFEQWIGNPDPIVSRLGARMLLTKQKVEGAIGGGMRAVASPKLLERWEKLMAAKLDAPNLRATIQVMRDMMNDVQSALPGGAAAPAGGDGAAGQKKPYTVGGFTIQEK
jgi:hypothetical protein